VAAWAAAVDALLAAVPEADLVAAPGLAFDPLAFAPGPVDPTIAGVADALLAIQAHLAVAAELRGDVFAVLDCLPLPDPPSAIETVVNAWQAALVAAIHMADAGARDSTRAAALYFPWVLTAETESLAVPPSGHVCGAVAAVDAGASVARAPANVALSDVVDVDWPVDDALQASLDASVNCLRVFRAQGVVVWGARTLSDVDASRYVSVRRVLLTVGRWLRAGTAWAVFEPNDARLWLRMNREISAYLMSLFQRGFLKGRTASEAFTVKCDAETNPPAAQAAGTLTVLVGLAAAAPAEMIVVRLTQSTAGAQVAVDT
jgi:phage tail sheath protein FI